MRRYSRTRRRGELPPGVIVGIVAAVVLIGAIVAGNILNSCLDDETYKKLTAGETGTRETTEEPQTRTSPTVQAEMFRLGNSLRTLGDDPPRAVSIPLNEPDGTMLYTSSVVSYLGLETAENAATGVKSRMEALGEEVPNLIGVWSVAIPRNADEAVAYAAAATDAAVLQEFLSMGGTEILLTDLPLDDDAFEISRNYLVALRRALGQSAVVSVAVPLSVAESETGWDILYALGRTVSFLTLDLRAEADIGIETETGSDTGTKPAGTKPVGTEPETDAPAEESPLVRARFYLSGYRMRLLLASSQTNLLKTARETVSDYAVR